MTINKVVFIVTLPLLLGLSSCGDDEFTTTVSGKVVNFGSREPIEGAHVYLQDGVGASGVVIYEGNTSSGKRNETLTDANGEFTVSLTGEHIAYLSAGKENYQFIIAQEGAAVGVKSYGRNGGNFENQVIELKAEAGFNPLFVSKVPIQPTDSIVVLFQDFKSNIPANQVKEWLSNGWSELCVGQQNCRLVPTFTLEEYVAPMIGDTYARYQIAYTRNGQWETKIDSVFVKSLEVYTDIIYY